MNSKDERQNISKKLKNRRIIYGASTIIGAIGGYLYYYFIGCASGTCPLRANPYYNIIMGAILGYLFIELILGQNKKKDKSEN